MTTQLDRPQTYAPLRQLALPLPDPERIPPRLPPDTPILDPPQVWTHLSLAQRAQVRQAFLRVLREVLHEHPAH
jgi:hypothetical protein